MDRDANRAAIIGDGPELDNLNVLVRKLKCEKYVFFQGYIAHHKLPIEMVSHDIFVFPTRMDCFGLVVAEAVACHLPVICSCYAGAACDLIRDNGIIVDPTQIASLSAAMTKLVRNPKLRAKMAEACNDVIAKHNLKTAVRGFMTALGPV